MKQITQNSVEELRRKILKDYALVVETALEVQKVRREDFDQMSARLKAALNKLNRFASGMRLNEKSLRELVEEIDTLRQYFGAATGRPLESEGVRYIAPYQETLRSIFLMINRHMIIYVEMIRNSLALLEYQIPRGEDITTELTRLLRNLELLRHFDGETVIQDADREKLSIYLQELDALLHPLYSGRDESRLGELLTVYYVYMAAIMAYFECEPEDVTDTMEPVVMLAIGRMIRRGLRSEFEAFALKAAISLAWEWDMEEEDRKVLAYGFKLATEVLGDA